MGVPLVLLAGLSVVGGVFGVPPSLGGTNAIEHWLEPVFAPALEKLALAPHESFLPEYILMALSVVVAVGGILVARRWYAEVSETPAALSTRFARAYGVLRNKYFVDEFYDAAVVRPLLRLSERLLWKVLDVGVIDWTVNALARATGALSRTVRMAQTGIAQTYAVVFLLGVVTIVAWLLAK